MKRSTTWNATSDKGLDRRMHLRGWDKDDGGEIGNYYFLNLRIRFIRNCLAGYNLLSQSIVTMIGKDISDRVEMID